MTFLATVALILGNVPGANVNDDVGFQLKSVAYRSGADLAARGLASVDTSDEDASISLTNDPKNRNASLSLAVTWLITWSPNAKGETPPKSLLVTVWQGYGFRAAGDGRCSLAWPSGKLIDTSSNEATIANGGGPVLASDRTYRLELTPRPDGSADGTLTVFSDTFSATYDSQDNVPTCTTGSVALASFDLPFAGATSGQPSNRRAIKTVAAIGVS